MKKYIFSNFVLAFFMVLSFSACGSSGEDDGNDAIVEISDNGETSKGSRFSAIDDNNFYLDYIKYTVKEGHLVVSGYDDVGFKGVAKIVPAIKFKGYAYEVLEIGDKAFYECEALTSITIPNSVTEIGSRAFHDCDRLTSVTLSNSIKEFRSYAFEGCTGLTSITIPNSVTRIGTNAFEGCTGLTSITIPNSVTEIESSVFEGCTGLTSITIPNSVTKIGSSTFYRCTGLTSITIPNSVTEIGYYAFMRCTELTSITLSNSLKTIGRDAFSYCTKLNSIHCKSTNPPSADAGLGLDHQVRLYIPSGTREAYASTWPWNDFKNVVEE